jgi:hypothetical protein
MNLVDEDLLSRAKAHAIEFLRALPVDHQGGRGKGGRGDLGLHSLKASCSVSQFGFRSAN